MSSIISVSAAAAWPYIRRFLFKDMPIKDALAAHWHSWFILAAQAFIFVMLFFMYEQALLQSRSRAEIVTENKTLKQENKQLKDDFQFILPSGIADLDSAMDIGNRVLKMENEVIYYKDLYTQTYEQLELYKAKEGLECRISQNKVSKEYKERKRRIIENITKGQNLNYQLKTLPEIK